MMFVVVYTERKKVRKVGQREGTAKPLFVIAVRSFLPHLPTAQPAPAKTANRRKRTNQTNKPNGKYAFFFDYLL